MRTLTARERSLCENVHQITMSLDFDKAKLHFPDSMDLQSTVLNAALKLEEVGHEWNGGWIEVCEDIGLFITNTGRTPAVADIGNFIALRD